MPGLPANMFYPFRTQALLFANFSSHFPLPSLKQFLFGKAKAVFTNGLSDLCLDARNGSFLWHLEVERPSPKKRANGQV